MSEKPTDSSEEELIEKELTIEENFQEKYLRTLADLENTRKRMQKEKQETIRFSIENAICEFLPAIDQLENALKFSESASDETKNWAMGFQMILSQFKDILHNHGITAFHSEGNTFDPHFHEAVEIEKTNDYPDGFVIQEFAKGYKSGLRTLRPARVKVAKTPEEDSSSEESSSKQDAEEEITK